MEKLLKLWRGCEYKNRSPRKGGSGWVKPAYYKARREMRGLSLAKLFQEGQ
jgi:hypothetical protein